MKQEQIINFIRITNKRKVSLKENLVKELIKLGYIVNYCNPIGKLEAKKDILSFATNLKIDSHSEHGFAYKFGYFLPISYVIMCIERNECDLGEEISGVFYPHFTEESFKINI